MAAITDMLADEDFQTDFDVQDDMLDDLRDDIKDADTPQWIIDALTAMHAVVSRRATSLRYRSSTNNEDLPGLQRGGVVRLQDAGSRRRPQEDGIDKSLKGVFASLWNVPGVHGTGVSSNRSLGAAMMGVLVHPNYKDELANGVAASFDPYPRRGGARYYVNSQLGEDLVTNPRSPRSLPEEGLLLASRWRVLRTLSTSNLVGSRPSC